MPLSGEWQPNQEENDAARQLASRESMEARLVQALAPVRRMAQLQSVLTRMLNDLPSKRDWLDPALEAEARALLQPAPTSTDQIHTLQIPNSDVDFILWMLGYMLAEADRKDKAHHDYIVRHHCSLLPVLAATKP